MDLLDGNKSLDDKHQGLVSLFKSGPTKALHIARFLPREERNEFFDIVCKNQDVFQSLGLPGTPAGPTKHFSLEMDRIGGKGSDAIQTVHKLLARRIIDQLPIMFETLGIEPFNVSDMPINLINGLHGHWADTHADSTNGEYQISILYYFHRVPKMFSGGDLEFYASDDELLSGHSEKPLFSIDLEDNLLVAFPSETFHGVTKVLSDSKDVVDGRFVAVGFLGS